MFSVGNQVKMRARNRAASRRKFLRESARHTILLAVALLTATALKKSRGQRCRKDGICSSCRVFEACTLPPALQEKNTRGGA
jgi:hypothetical protein